MGVCASKQDTTSTSNDNMSGTRTVRTKQTTGKTKTQNSTKEKSKKPQFKKTNSEGNVVGASLHSKEDKNNGVKAGSELSPREAARLAAEKRLQEQTKKLAKGELGKKLAEQKGLKV
ncbi:hypothetical protein MOSE0_N11430 [Monosporozyma servazzii]